MNKTVLYTCLGGALLALGASPLLFSKAHVPLDRVQVCDPGNAVSGSSSSSSSSSGSGSGGPVIKTIKLKKMQQALANGACRFSACDFGNVKQTGDSCDATDATGHPINSGPNGICDSVEPPANSGVGGTAACTQPF